MRKLRLTVELAVATLFMAMMVGWKTGSLDWVKWLPGRLPALFNTSLFMFLCALSAMALRFERKELVRFFSSLALLLSLMTFLQFIFYTPWEIDQLFHFTPLEFQPVTPGRMAANTALAFVLLSSSFLLRTFPQLRRVSSWTMTLAFAVSAVSFAGYLFELGTSFGWGDIGKMAPITATCIFLLTLVNWETSREEAAAQVAIGLLTLTVLLTFGIFYSEETLIKERIKSVIARDQILFERSLLERESSLRRLASRSTLRAQDLLLWEKDAGHYVRDFSDMWRIYFVKRDGSILLKTENAASSIPAGLPLETAFATGKSRIYLDPNLRGKLFWFIVPSENRQGATVSLHETQSFLESVLGKMWSSQEVYIDDTLAISTLSKKQKEQQKLWGAEFQSNYAGSKWRIRSFPKESDLSTNVDTITFALLCTGILLSIAAYLMIHFYAQGRANFERELRLKQDLQTVLDFVPAGIFRTNQNGECTWVNQRWTLKTGLTEKEALGAGWQRAIHPDDRLQVFQEWESSVREGRPFDLVYRFQGPHKPVVWVHGRTVALHDGAGELVGYLGSVVDVTAERKIQEELKEQQLDQIYADKMKAVGELATGISYQINNPLAVTRGTVETIELLMEKKQLTDKILSECLQKITAMTQRSMKIVKSLRDFTRDGKQEPPQAYRVSALIHNALDFCSARFKSQGVDIRVGHINDEWEVLCRPSEIEQVLFSLLSNSFDAVKRITNPWIEIGAELKDDKIVFFVTDAGEGISSDIVDKIMDPFFTTKDKREHTGLGLSISRNIIRAHDGELVLIERVPHAKFGFSLKRV